MCAHRWNNNKKSIVQWYTHSVRLREKQPKALSCDFRKYSSFVIVFVWNGAEASSTFIYSNAIHNFNDSYPFCVNDKAVSIYLKNS